MPIIDYPFVQVMSGVEPKPALFIRVINPLTKQSFRTVAAIDTGADESCFPAEIAQLLDCELSNMESKQVAMAGGSRKAYKYKLSIDVLKCADIGDPQKEFVKLRMLNIPIILIDGLKGFILGQKGFLDHFVLTINYERKVFSLRNPRYKKSKAEV